MPIAASYGTARARAASVSYAEIEAAAMGNPEPALIDGVGIDGTATDARIN